MGKLSRFYEGKDPIRVDMEERSRRAKKKRADVVFVENLKPLSEPKEVIEIFREFSLARCILPEDDELRQAVREELTFFITKVSYSQSDREQFGGARIIEKQAYHTRMVGDCLHILVAAGFIHRLASVLHRFKYAVKVVENSPDTYRRHMKRMRFYPDLASGEKLRGDQQVAIDMVLNHDRGLIHWPTAAGKSFTMAYLARTLPKAKILITSAKVEVCMMLFNRLRQHIPGVGFRSGAKKVPGDRVWVVTQGTLSNFYDEEWDIVLVDEQHLACTEGRTRQLMAINAHRAFGLSANIDDRLDNADYMSEGLFGPRVAKITYSEAVRKKMVVPIKVLWVDCKKCKASQDLSTVDRRNRYGLWRNHKRNQLIVSVIKQMQGQQILTYAQKVEHVLRLYAMLGDDATKVVFGKQTKERIIELQQDGLWPEGLAVDEKYLAYMRQAFKSQEIMSVICNSVWDTGVDFEKLQVCNCVDGAASTISNTQSRGRVSRRSEGKDYGIVVDYDDEFDDVLRERANTRKRFYKELGWEQDKFIFQTEPQTD